MRQVLFWGALPFVIPQALHVRKTALRFARAAGPRKGFVGEGQSLSLLGVGDSIIAGVGASRLSHALVGQTAAALAEMLHDRIDWTARGLVGATSEDILQRLIPKLPQQPADFILLSVGVNDVTALSTVSRWSRNLSALLCALHNHSPDAMVAVAGIPPLGAFPLLPQPMRALFGLRADAFDTAARSVTARHPNAVYVPVEIPPDTRQFAADGYHPSETGYREFGRVTAARLIDGGTSGRDILPATAVTISSAR